jgi:hypothetical protein
VPPTFRWVYRGNYAELDALYAHESHRGKQVRAVIFWLWLILGVVLIVGVSASG